MIYFKTPRLQKEWLELPNHNRRLEQVLKALEIYCQHEFKKDVTLTSLWRSPEENAQVGGIPNSPHCVWNAADIRSTTFEPEELQKIVTFLNCFTYRPGKKTAVFHAVPGGALHCHIQVLKG